MIKRRFDIPSDRRFNETEYVVDGSHEDSFNVWHRWSFLFGLDMEQDSCGHMTEIGKLTEYTGESDIRYRPICVTVFWYIVEGYRVAFVEGTSQLVDHKMVEDWECAVFRCLRNYRDRHSNATNFHNIMLDIRRRREAKGLATPLRDINVVEATLHALPLENGSPGPRRMSWRDADAIAAYVAGDGTDETRLALADGIREGRRGPLP